MKKLLLLPFLFLFFAISCDDEINDTTIMEPEAVVAGKSTFTGNSYLVISATDKLPDGLATGLASANGKVTRIISEVGIAVVSSDDPNFASKASKIKGVQSVVPNLTRQWLDPKEKNEALVEDFGNPPSSGDDDIRFDLQWGHDAIDAPEAWNAGYRGAGARVAVLDGGFDLDHPDLEPNINFTLSIDFTGEGLQYAPSGPFSHGTHVAGTIAAADNGYGIIGVAPEAELVLVKVLGDGGSGTFADVISGIVHAALADADVINMSLGGYLEKSGNAAEGYTVREAIELINATSRAVNFAYQRGTTVIAAAGNAAIDFDHTADLVHIPGDCTNAISISATAPIGWVANPPSASLDYLTSYSNYGQSAISFAAPGGDSAYPGNENCTVGGITRPCWVFDLVFSDGNGGVGYWSAGTSMASPHAAGVAALIVGKNGGSMKPAQVEAAMRASADDLGKPGKDDAYGNGRVNAFRAVSQ